MTFLSVILFTYKNEVILIKSNIPPEHIVVLATPSPVHIGVAIGFDVVFWGHSRHTAEQRVVVFTEMTSRKSIIIKKDVVGSIVL